MRQIQRDGGERPGQTTAEKLRIKEFERENRNCGRVRRVRKRSGGSFSRRTRFCARLQCILPRCERQCGTASALPVAARPPVSQMMDFAARTFVSLRKAEKHSGSSRSARRCSSPVLLPGRRIARQFCREGTYYDRRAIARDPELASCRAKSDAALSLKIDAAWEDNRKLYGARKIWHVLRRDGEDVAPLSANACIRAHSGQRLHSGTVDAQSRDQGGGSRQKGHNDEPGYVSAVPRRQSEPSVQGGSAEQAVGRAIVRHWFKNNGERLHLESI